MADPLSIRTATTGDAASIAQIYAHHVIHGVASWELEPPSLNEMEARIAKVEEAGWPWIVAEMGGEMVGYAYAGQMHPRAGYRYACEDSIYIRADRTGRGLGKALLAALIEAAEGCGFRQMVALIAGSEAASVALHARFGFVEAGRLKSVGWKHGGWQDVLFMQRALGAGDRISPPRE